MLLFIRYNYPFILYNKTHKYIYGFTLYFKVNLFIVFLFFCFFLMPKTPVEAQITRFDSLKTVLSAYKNRTDTLYLKSLGELVYQLFLFQADSATYYAKKLEAQSQKAGYLQGQAKGLKMQGLINSGRGEYEMALNNLEKSLELYQKIKIQKEIAEVINEMGLVYNHKGNYSKALESYYESLKIAEDINDLPIIAANYNNIAGIHINQGDVNKALLFFEKSLEVNVKAKNKRGIARSYHNIGGIYTEQKKYDEALTYFYKVIAIEKEIDSRLIGFETLSNIGYVYYHKQDYTKSLAFFEESNLAASKMENDFIKILNYTGIADVYYAQKNYSESIENAKKALAIAIKKEILLGVSTLRRILYKNYKAQKNYQKALEYYELYKQSNDSIFNIDQTKIINNLENQAEIERKEKEISILNNDKKLLEAGKAFQEKVIYLVIISLLLMCTLTYFIYRSRLKERKANNIISIQNEQLKSQTEEIQTQADKLRKTNADKDRLFAIIGHDLRSPIHSLKGLLYLFENKQISPEEFILFSDKLKSNVEHVNFTLNNLLLWANSQIQGI